MRKLSGGLCGLVLSLFVFGCGGDDGGGGGGVTAADALAACNSYCDTYAAAACADPIYTSAADCTSSDCADLSQAPAGCRDEVKAYYDCRKALTGAALCDDTGCTSQFAALASCS
jgi:hypothetical protein